MGLARKASKPTSRATRTPATDAPTEYAQAVLAGEIVACEKIKLACRRHLRDLKDGPKRGLAWRPDSAAYYIGVFEKYLKHSKGEWAGKPVLLGLWQKFVVGSVYGWKRADGSRRFRFVYEELPRKNGKSLKLAGVGIIGLVFDLEDGAEIYSAAPLALDTTVPTADGWKTMGTLAVGDRVFDEAGRQCSVTYVSPIADGKPCYRITLSDGTCVVADGDHRWVTDAIERRSRGGRQIGRIAVRTTAEIRDTARTKAGRPNHRIMSGAALACDAAALPIPPYTLGAWLGDGRSNRGKLIGTWSDATEIIEHISSEGSQVSDHGKSHLREFTVLGLRTLLRSNDLLDAKHIPQAYFRADFQQRLALLQGLMDTDGTCTKTGECRFTNRSRILAVGVRDLVRGLGLRTQLRADTVAGAPHYVVSFKSCRAVPVFRIRRKALRQRPAQSETLRWRQIVSVEEVPSVPVRCISVDSPSHLYLVTDGLLPTHNTKKDQAKIIFDEAKRMVAKSPELASKVRRFKDNLSVDATYSKFEPLSADENTLDGLNPHYILADELHKHRTRALLDVLDTAVGSRRQPLIWIITTAGDDNPESVYAQENEYATKVLEGTVEDDNVFAFIATIDKGDKWDDPVAWAKANPNLGVSVRLDDLERQARKAAKAPSAMSAFKRLRLNVRSAAAERAVDMAQWALNSRGRFDPADLQGRRCFGGLDLSSKIDISAFVKLFEPDEENRLRVAARFWMPADTLEAKSERDKVQYRRWVEEGWIETTPGNVIDHGEIQNAVLDDHGRYDIQSIGYDPWNATQLAVALQGEGVPMSEFIQGSRSYAQPTAEFEALVAGPRLDHGGNPVLAWMMSNLKFTRDKNDNKMPNKQHSTGRIDGASALIMAIGRWMAEDDTDGSIYDDPTLWEKRDGSVRR